MAFIVLEGLDGAGTTTQRERLATRLRDLGLTVVTTHEPTDGPVGREIRATLRRAPGAVDRSCLPWMFAADRADHLSRTVDPALQRGSFVLSDRYLHSSLAYQSLDLPFEDVFALNQRFRVPDLTVFVRVSVETSLSRITARGGVREIFEEREQLTRIAASYERVLERLHTRGDPIAYVDGEASITDVEQAIWRAVEPLARA
jgi:dTMP kinase